MREEEEIDWIVYHRINDGMGTTIPELIGETGLTRKTVEESLSRLVECMLIDRNGDYFRKLSIQEMLVSCQGRYDESCPITFEHGLIRARHDRER